MQLLLLLLLLRRAAWASLAEQLIHVLLALELLVLAPNASLETRFLATPLALLLLVIGVFAFSGLVIWLCCLAVVLLVTLCCLARALVLRHLAVTPRQLESRLARCALVVLDVHLEVCWKLRRSLQDHSGQIAKRTLSQNGYGQPKGLYKTL